MFNMDLSSIIVRIPALLIAFAFHEWGHAVVADYFGDPTPRSQGRLSLNPFVHLDIFGTLLVLFSGFGWAKPVYTNPSNYRGNKRRADFFVSLAGVAMNLLIAFVTTVIVGLVIFFAGGNSNAQLLQQVLWEVVALNISLAVFNILPIPPLDGFHVLVDILPEEIALNLYRYEQYGMLILLFILILPGATTFLEMPVQFIFNLFEVIAGNLLHLFGVG